jgi:hypothetical protein
LFGRDEFLLIALYTFFSFYYADSPDERELIPTGEIRLALSP